MTGRTVYTCPHPTCPWEYTPADYTTGRALPLASAVAYPDDPATTFRVLAEAAVMAHHVELEAAARAHLDAAHPGWDLDTVRSWLTRPTPLGVWAYLTEREAAAWSSLINGETGSPLLQAAARDTGTQLHALHACAQALAESSPVAPDIGRYLGHWSCRWCDADIYRELPTTAGHPNAIAHLDLDQHNPGCMWAQARRLTMRNPRTT